MAANSIILEGEDGNLELEILEETMIQGNNYILVTDAGGDDDGDCYIMKDVSEETDSEARYIFLDGEEAEAVMEVFASMLEDEDIIIEK